MQSIFARRPSSEKSARRFFASLKNRISFYTFDLSAGPCITLVSRLAPIHRRVRKTSASTEFAVGESFERLNRIRSLLMFHKANKITRSG